MSKRDSKQEDVEQPKDSDSDTEYVVEEFEASIDKTQEPSTDNHAQQVDLCTTDLSSIKKQRSINYEDPYSDSSQDRYTKEANKRKQVIDYLLKDYRDNKKLLKTKAKNVSRESRRNKQSIGLKTYNAVVSQKISSKQPNQMKKVTEHQNKQINKPERVERPRSKTRIFKEQLPMKPLEIPMNQKTTGIMTSRNVGITPSKTAASIHERLYDQKLGHLKESMVKQIEEDKLKFEKELTFQPRQAANNNKSAMFSRKRSAIEFYKDQTDFQNRKGTYIITQLEEKDREIERLRQQLEDTKRARGQSSDKLREIIGNQPVMPGRTQHAYDKYTRVGRSKSPDINAAPKDVSFRPDINDKSKRIVRKSDVCSMLYQDAKDREVRQRDRINSEISNTRKRANSRHLSNERSNNKFMVNKLIREMNDACKENNIYTNRPISYHEMVKLMYSMGYICDNITEYEKLLIDNMFQSLMNRSKHTVFL